MIHADQIQKWVEEAIAGTDIFIVEIKVLPARIVVFVDKPAAITIDECAAISRQLYAHLDPAGILDHAELEVSSPGMDAPLRVPQQYMRRINREVSITLPDGKEIQGIITHATAQSFTANCKMITKEGKKKIETIASQTFNYGDIRETKLVLKFK